jgi:hypothetical protein
MSIGYEGWSLAIRAGEIDEGGGCGCDGAPLTGGLRCRFELCLECGGLCD